MRPNPLLQVSSHQPNQFVPPGVKTKYASRSYKTKLVQPTVKALTMSTKTQLRINERGTLNLQHMYVTDNDQTSFLDFYVIPLEEDEEDMEA